MLHTNEITINGEKYVKKTSSTNDEGLRYAIVRSRNQGVMCGYVISIDGQNVKLKNARQIFKYSSRFVLPDIAEFGLTKKFESQLSCAMSEDCLMTEACGVLYCTDVGRDSLINEVAKDFS
jgi:hypothetical protein